MSTETDDAKLMKLGSEWLKRSFKRWGRKKTGKELAARLGIDASGVTAMKQGKRRIQLSELPKIAAFFEEEIPSEILHVATPVNNKSPARLIWGSEQAVPLIRVTAIIAAGVWREAGVTVAIGERVPASPDPRAAASKQYACRIEAEANHYAICVPYADLRNKPTAKDVVHVRRTRPGVYEDTVRVVQIANGHVHLQLNGSKDKDTALAYPSNRPGEDIEIKGLVVGWYQAASF